MGKRASRDEDDDAEARQARCRGTMKALNAQFAQWVAERAVSSPIVSWAKGCEDYLKHLNGIKAEFKDVLESSSDASASIAAPPTLAAPAANPFGGAPKPGPPAAGSIFGTLPTAPGSLFGAPPAAGSSAGSLFPPAGSLFGASASAPGGGFGGASTSVVEDDEDDEPPRPSSPSYQANEATEDDKEHVVMRVNKVKLHTKKDASEPNWADRGVNSFEFRREKVASGDDGSKRCRLLMRNQIGKAVLNAALYAKMSAQLTEKKMKDGSVVKNGVIVTLFNAEEENSKVMVYLRFGKESDAKELHKLITENS